MKTNNTQFNEDQLRRLRVASPAERQRALMEFMAQEGKSVGHLIRLEGELSPVALFKYLLARFGEPTGFINDYVARPDSGILWHYVLMLDDYAVELTGFGYRTDVVFHPALRVECSAQEFAHLIKADLKAREKQVAAIVHKLRKWISFLNPYSHLLHTGRSLLGRAEELDGRLSKSRKHPDDVKELRWQLANHAQACSDASELAGVCLALRMVAPVMAETFVNLVIFKASKTNLRSNDYHKRYIQQRIEGLHHQCDGFRRPVSTDAPEYKEFQRMMVARNNLLHGNIIPDSQPEQEILYTYVHPNGTMVPIYHEWKSMYDRSIASRLEAHSLARARQEFAAAQGFVSYVLDCMDEATKADFVASLKFVNMHFDKKQHLLTALLNDDLVDSLPADLFEQMGGGDGPFISAG
jgi:hypothetical protein